MIRHLIVIIAAAVLFWTAAPPAFASEKIEHHTGVSPYKLDEYSRSGSRASITFTNTEGGNATAVVQCGNPNGGTWQAIDVSGVCYSKNFCFKVATSAVEQVKATTLAGKTITSQTVVPDTEGKVTNLCYNVTKDAALSDVQTHDYTKCTGSTVKNLKGLDGNPVKNHCVFDYSSGDGGIVGVDPDNQNDDMFRIKKNAAAFFEYVDRSASLNNRRLRWIERADGSNEIMLPSGPHAGTGKYKDYDLFMTRTPGGVHTEDACYPTQITMCADSPPPANAPPTPGVCGSANEKTYLTLADLPAGGRCYLGTPGQISEDEHGYSWSCAGMPDSQPADHCTAKKEENLVVDPERPSEEVRPPTDACFFHVTGLLLSNSAVDSWYTEIGKVDEASQLVGPGDYTQAEPFLRASSTTFDGIALGHDTRVIIYDHPDFKGKVLFDGHGPMVINNFHYRKYEPKVEQNGGQMDTWLTETWPGDFNQQFPPATRKWSAATCEDATNPKCMWNWGGASQYTMEDGSTVDLPYNEGRRTSLKVMCGQEDGQCGSANGTTVVSAPTTDLCKYGTPTSVDGTGPWKWLCKGQDGGKDSATCTAGVMPPAGTCRTYSSAYTSQPASSASSGCKAGTYADAADTDTLWMWTCAGTTTATSCIAKKATTIDGACTYYGDTPYAAQPASGTENGCTAGTYADVSDTGTHWQWKCTGGGYPTGKTVTCLASKETAPNGACKPFGTATYASQPASSTATGCTAGNYVDVNDTDTQWTWTCAGTETTETCTANKPTTINGTCKAYNSASSQPASDTASGCETGTYTDISDSDTQWKWRCVGSGTPTGYTANCAVDKCGYAWVESYNPGGCGAQGGGGGSNICRGDQGVTCDAAHEGASYACGYAERVDAPWPTCDITTYTCVNTCNP